MSGNNIDQFEEDSKSNPDVFIFSPDTESELALESAKLHLEEEGHKVMIVGGGRNVGRKEVMRLALGTIGHVNHGSSFLTSQTLKDKLEEVINNIEAKNIINSQFRNGSMQESLEYKLYNDYANIPEISEGGYYDDPLRKKYRKQNNAKHPANSKKKKKAAKQARKNNRKK